MATWNHIATNEVGSGGSATIQFTSISQSYDHLCMRWLARSEASGYYDYMEVQFNSDTAANYYYWRNYGIGGSSGASGNIAGGQNELKDFLPISKTTGDGWSGGELWIPNYSGTTANTSCIGFGASSTWATGSSQMLTALGGGYWTGSTDGVDEILLKTDSGNDFTEHTRVTLYGVNGDPTT